MKKVLAICGSTRAQSSNLQFIQAIKELSAQKFELILFDGLAELPHFNSDLDKGNPPQKVIEWRKQITEADGILICTPEYVFSLPGTLKNAIEWLVSTTILAHKPTALITASGMGQKAHEELLLIMKTVEAKFTLATQLHISGARTKIDSNNQIIHEETLQQVTQLINGLMELLD